jgi:hypothetical protein
MGFNVAYRLLQTQFSNQPLTIARQSFDKTYLSLGSSDTGRVYLLLTKKLNLTNSELHRLLQFVARGNTLFVSAESIDTAFTKILHVNMINKEWLNLFFNKQKASLMQDVKVRITHPYTGVQESYGFFYHSLDTYFLHPDSTQAGVFGTGNDGSPNYVGIKYGSGNIWLHSNPLLFSNYFLLTKNNYQYLERVFSYINNKPTGVYWDDYYHTARYDRQFFSLQVFFQYPSLTAALLLGMSLLLLYVAFGGKRKQRPIPVKVTPVNSSVSFVQTVSLLYLQKKDNRNIALKMIAYFLEYVRQHYFLSTNLINDEFVKALSRKSAVKEERVRELTLIIENVNRNDSVSDVELLDLHNRIREFYKQ